MSPPNRCRWLQFRLRTLLIGVTLTACVLGYVTWEREQCRRGEVALTMVQRYSMGISPRDILDTNWEELLESAKPSSTRPEWLQGILGNDRFRFVESATLQGAFVTDADLRNLAALSNLREICIHAPNVTEKGLAHLHKFHMLEKFSFEFNDKISSERWEVLAEWPKLRELSLEFTSFGDEGLPHLAKLTNLKQLQLRRSKITDADLDAICSLNDLELLDLAGTEITDAGLIHLSKLTNLRYLNLAETKVRGPGLVHLSQLPKLESLLLYRCPLTDAGLAGLEKCIRLETLGLSLTEISDAGLPHLAGLTKLQSLGLSGTKISDTGLSQLHRLQNLQSLGLAGTSVSDRGMVHLGHLKKLNKLFLHKTSVTKEGSLSLSASSPAFVIDWQRLEDPLDDFDPYAMITKPYRPNEDPFAR